MSKFKGFPIMGPHVPSIFAAKGPDGAPSGVTLTAIAGGNRITFTPAIGYQTEIWVSIDSADYVLLGRYANSVTSVDHTGLYAQIVDYKLRGVLDDAVYDTDAINYFDRMGSAIAGEYPDEARKVILNTLFTTGKTKPFWNKLAAIWLIAAHGVHSAALDLFSDNFNITQFGVACDFEIDRGFTTALNKYLITNFNPSVNNEKYTLNDASMGVYVRTNNAGNGYFIGTGTSGNQSYIQRVANTVYSSVNGTAYTTTPTTETRKLIVSRRLSNTVMAVFLDKTKDEESKASAGVPNAIFNIGLNNYNQYAFAYIGSGIDDQDESDMYDVIVDGYLTSIGAKI